MGKADFLGEVLKMSMEIVQILKPDGTLSSGYYPDLNEEQLKELYRLMVLTRAYDDRGMKLQRQGRIGFYIGCKGQEASHIGSAYALKNEDWVFPAYREPGILFLRGVPLKKLICQMIGNAGDETHGRQMPCHFSFREANYSSISSPLATQIPHAVGAAFAAKYQGDQTITLTYFGDGSTSEGDFHVGMNFAAVYKAPVIFVCQNNQYAISVPIGKQTVSESIAIKASAYGMPGIKVDGNDILAMYHVTKEAAERARNGGGPTLIEAFTYRIGPHSSSDDDKRYRKTGEMEEWQEKDPISRFEKYLKAQGIMSEDEFRLVAEKCQEELNEAVREAEKLGPPPLETLFTDVYAEMPANLREQMLHLLDEQTRLGSSADSSEAFPL